MRPEEVSELRAGPSIKRNFDEVHMQVELQKELEGVKILNRKGPLVTRPCSGSKGQKMLLLSNYFKVSIFDKVPFYHYDVSLLHGNGEPVGSEKVRRKVIAKLHETYKSELAERSFAYDGGNSFYTVGPLPNNKQDFVVVLNAISLERSVAGGDLAGTGIPCENDQKRQRLNSSATTFKVVHISFVSAISTRGLADASTERVSETHEGLTVLNTVLRQHAAKRDRLLLRHSYFSNEPKNFMDLGGGILGCRGFSSRFQAVQGGLFLNFDISTTTTIKPGPVIDFLISHQNASDPFKIDWLQAKRVLKNLRITISHRKQEYKVTGLSENPCKHQKFCKRLGVASNQDGVDQTIEMTVYDYFVKMLSIPLVYSADFPCIDVGAPRRPTYFPIELCSLVSLQCYKKALSSHQRTLLTEKSRLKPEDLSPVLTKELKCNNYNDDPLLRSCGLSISNHLTQVEGRVLSSPRLKVGNGEDLIPRNASWSFRNKGLLVPKRVECWAVVNFSSQHDIRSLCKELVKVGGKQGLIFNAPMCVLEENPKYKKKLLNVRVAKMCEQISSEMSKDPLQFILCLIEKPFSPLYGAWKWKSLIELGVPNQCLAKMRVDDSYLGNVILKINAKLGGLNSSLKPEVTRSIPWVSKAPTMILGMDYLTCVYEYSDLTSIAAVISLTSLICKIAGVNFSSVIINCLTSLN